MAQIGVAFFEKSAMITGQPKNNKHRASFNEVIIVKRKDVNMLSGNITKGLLTISLPLMVQNVLQSLFNIVDMTVLKNYDTASGGLAVGAVGACSVLISLITSLVIGLSVGANALIARNIGKHDKEAVERSVGTAIATSIVGGLALLSIGIVFARGFLNLANCAETLMDQAALYFRLYFAGVPILMVYNFCAAALRASGDSQRPMVYLILGGIIKVCLTFVFVALFKMGVVGVAIATIVSWTVSMVLGLRALLTNEGIVHLKPRMIRFYKHELQSILRIGVPSGLQQAMYSVANLVISATVNSYGAQATTGISIANNYDGILYQISMAPSYAVLPYVSQNIGAGNIKRAKQSIIRGIFITALLGGGFGALSAIFSSQLASVMSSDPVVIAYAREKMVIISSLYFMQGINATLGESMKGMGKPMVPTVATFVFMCLIRFPWVWFVFPLYPNFTFLYLIWPIGWVLSITYILCFFFPTAKKLTCKYAHPEESKTNA